jgi:hypothetical protein
LAFKPNYNQQRAERDRAKRAKREEKLQLQKERTAQRKTGEDGAPIEDEENERPE